MRLCVAEVATEGAWEVAWEVGSELWPVLWPLLSSKSPLLTTPPIAGGGRVATGDIKMRGTAAQGRDAPAAGAT